MPSITYPLNLLEVIGHDDLLSQLGLPNIKGGLLLAGFTRKKVVTVRSAAHSLPRSLLHT